MNEVTITQAIAALSTYWWLMVPVTFGLAYHVGGILAFTGNIMFGYVNRSKEKVFDWPVWVMSLFFTGANRYSGSRIDHDMRDDDRPWFYCDFGRARYTGEEERIMYMTFLFPLFLLVACAILHFMPMWFMYGVLSIMGMLWTARLATDGIKKASSVLEALDNHKADRDAHTGPR